MRVLSIQTHNGNKSFANFSGLILMKQFLFKIWFTWFTISEELWKETKMSVKMSQLLDLTLNMIFLKTL